MPHQTHPVRSRPPAARTAFCALALSVLLAGCEAPREEAPLPPRIAALTDSADAGDRLAQYNLAVAYYRGEEVPRDYARAALRWRQAAAQGDAKARSNLAYLTFNGLGVPRDEAAAVTLWREAAAGGSLEANLHLGYAAAEGAGRDADPVEAFARYRAAVLASHPDNDVDGDIREMAMDGLRRLDASLSPAEEARAREMAEKYARRVVRAPGFDDTPKRP